MVDDPAATLRKLRRKGGRPSRAEASAKALLGVDLTTVDPVAILRAIAADRSMPGSTRVAACRACSGCRIRMRQRFPVVTLGSTRERPP